MTARHVALLSVFGLALVPSAFGVSAGPSEVVASKIVDRTLACTTEVHAGIRLMTVSFASAAAGQTEWDGQKALAHALLHTGGPILDTSTGPPSFSGGELLVDMRAGARRAGTLVISRKCKSTKTRVALSTRRLGGGAASPFADTFQCYPPKRILVRVRAVFRTPTVLRRVGGILVTSAAIREASFAARTESGNPLVYGAVAESGKARLFTAGGCVRD
jgi:hypothetical protein